MSSPPDPAAASSPGEFRAALTRLKAWAGAPSFGQLERRSAVPRSTLADALDPRRSTLPRLEVVVAFVAACGADAATVERWREAWRSLQVGRAGRVGRAGPDGPDDGAVRPRELPRAITEFVGRAGTLAALTACIDRDPPAPVVAICGTAGVGKTALAVHWAGQVAARFPDGQLFVNLRGYDRDHPIRPAEALGVLLRSLLPVGTPLPPELPARVGLFRTITAGRRLLVVLDNAESAEHVRDLLPAGPGCLALVTSRDALNGLVARDGASRIQLAALPADDAVALLARLAGGRTADGAMSELAERCARLPLALRLAAELLVARPRTAVSELLAELDQDRTLDHLDAGGDPASSVRELFALSYRKLAPGAARSFRLLGSCPGAETDEHALAALAGLTRNDARSVLRTLRQGHLVEEPRPGRYAMHDLLRSFAVELAEDLDPADRDAALGRLVAYYSQAAERAAAVLYPFLPAAAARSAGALPEFGTATSASAWLDAECDTLVALVVDDTIPARPGQVDALSTALTRYLKDTARYGEAAAVHSRAVAVARRAHDPSAEARALVHYANARVWVGDYDEVLELLAQARTVSEDSGETVALVQCLNGIGIVDQFRGRPHDAMASFRQAARLAIEIGWPFAEANATSNLGMCLEELGRYDEARERYKHALELYCLAGYRGGQGSAVENIGSVELRLGRIDRAVDRFGEALDIAREARWVGLQTTVSNNLGRALRLAGRLDDAAAHHRTAERLAGQAADRFQLAGALEGLGDVARDRGERAEAVRYWAQAQTIYAELGVPQAGETAGKIATRT